MTQRRTRLAAGLLAALLAGLGGCDRSPPSGGGSDQAGHAAERPAPPRLANVVIFLIDTLRFDRLGAYGYGKPTTPNIDALAGKSVVFEQCYAPAPWTAPSVASLMTSTFLCEHRVLVGSDRVSADLEPLAVRFRKAGYATASFYANPFAGPSTGLDQGFDLCRAVDSAQGRDVRPWLETTRGRPFFLYVHNVEPHNPSNASPRFLAQLGYDSVSLATRQAVGRRMGRFRMLSRAGFQAKQFPGEDVTERQTRAIAELDQVRPAISMLYDAQVRRADYRLGTVLNELKAQKRWPETLMIVVADHGEEFGEHGGWQHDQSVYEELVHVPMIVRFPGDEFAGRRIEDVVSLVDVLPTVFDYLRQPELARPARGRSLMPLVRGAGGRHSARPVIPAMRINKKKYYRPWKETRGDINIVVRQGDWKGIWNVETDSFELYDLRADPREADNVRSVHAGRVHSMRELAEAWYQAQGRVTAGTVADEGLDALDEKTLSRLRALGYVD